MMAPYVTWSCMSGTLGGHFRIVMHSDFGLILPQMHLNSGWFSCKDYTYAGFVEDIHTWTLCTNRLKISFNCN